MEEKLHENTLNRTQNYTKVLLFSCLFVFCFAWFSVLPSAAQAASLQLSPSAGAFTVGSTFEISLIVDTQGESINAVEVFLKFPPDKLQLVAPSNIGKSIVGVWTTFPKYDNQTGTINLQGVIPGGINAANGLIAKFTFRAKSSGSVIIRFLNDSKVLLNDGLGTDVLHQSQNGVYQLVLPPPAGPEVASETHPDQSKFYSNSTVILKWAADFLADGYSYILNKEPTDIPDDISEGAKSSVVYRNIADGNHYFHIKALRNNVWGGTTHFAVNIDTAPPAEFPINITPSSRTINQHSVVQFSTTDNLSGISHYELKLVHLNPVEEKGPLFIEVESPYVFPLLDYGKYDIIVRAYDKTGNFREVSQGLKIVKPIFKFVSDQGIEIKDYIVIPWIWIWLAAVLLIAGLGYLAWHLKKWHYRADTKQLTKELPSEVKQQIEELKQYRSKYGKLIVLLIMTAGLFGFSSYAFAQQPEIGPPLITSVSRNISNEEIFYIGGKTEAPNTPVIIYFQNLQSGETQSQIVNSDKRGDWFYRHSGFLSTGNYLLWSQSKIGDLLSPPSPQVQMTVRPTALQFGASRISYETIYLIIIIILILVLLGLVIYISFHIYHGRRKHKLFMKEVKEAEESVRRGFAVLRRDIEAELAVVKKAKLNKNLSAEEKLREEELLKDLAEVEKYIGKEIWDVEKIA